MQAHVPDREIIQVLVFRPQFLTLCLCSSVPLRQEEEIFSPKEEIFFLQTVLYMEE